MYPSVEYGMRIWCSIWDCEAAGELTPLAAAPNCSWLAMAAGVSNAPDIFSVLPKIKLGRFSEIIWKERNRVKWGSCKNLRDSENSPFSRKDRARNLKKKFQNIRPNQRQSHKTRKFRSLHFTNYTQKIQTGKIKSPKIGKNQKNLTNNLGFFSWAEGIKKIEKQEGDEFWRDCK